jgi:hypothetical protein
MDRMSPPAAQTQWYLARDSQQFGPLSDTELAKFIELGHLQPTDLLWREGFPDWRPAMVVFPPRKPAMQRPAPSARQAGPMAPQAAPGRGARQQAMARQGQDPRTGRPSQGRRSNYAEPEDAAPRRRGLRRALVVIICLAGLGVGSWYAYRNNEKLLRFVQTLPSRVPVGLLDMVTGKNAADRRNIETSPLKGLRGAPDALDQTVHEQVRPHLVEGRLHAVELELAHGGENLGTFHQIDLLRLS